MDSSYEITDDLKHDVLAATDIVALVGAVTGLKKAGNSWKGLCPFHGEKTPSFHVHPERGFYYCFGCGAKGDAITFVRETEKLEFPEAVAYLARRAGIPLPLRRSGSRADRAKETRSSEALLAAAAFFRDQLPRSAAAKAVLEGRGVPREEWTALGFGAAPDAWDGLLRALSGTFPEEVLLDAGLLQKNQETGRVYDRFRNRLTLEIRDARGEILAFGGRALGDDPAKYINSPETSRFTKGKVLYGLDRAREGARKSEKLVLCEGYFDRIAFERAGIPWAVASMGTALTPTQADLLARQVPAVVVAYDGDPPGLAAAWKAFPLLVERGVKVFHVAFPGKHDPDSFLRAHGPQALREAVEKAKSLLDVLAEAVPPATGDAAERAARINEAKAILTVAPDRVYRHELLAAFSRASGVPLELLHEGSRRSPVRRPDPETAAPTARAVPEAEESVLGILLASWPAGAEIAGKLPGELFSHPDARELADGLKSLASKPDTLDFSELQSHLGGGAGVLAARLLLSDPSRPDESPNAPDLEKLRKPLLQLKIRRLEERGVELQPAIFAAEARGDRDVWTSLSAEKQKLSAELHRMKRELRRPDQGPGGQGKK
ncbi:MAG: DNA primase [Thermoanaerobaculia bacterium]